MADDTDQTSAATERTERDAERRRGPDDVNRGAEAVWHEVDRDMTRDLASPAPAATREPDRIGENEQKPEPVKRDPNSFPDEISRGYYMRTDMMGDQHIYADSRGNREIFQASENRLRTKLEDPQCVKMMLDTAAHRGWASVSVKGSNEFKREAWLEGQARGIAVDGYKPNDLDLQELKRREQAHLRNELSPTAEHGRDAGATPQTGRKTARDGAANSNDPILPEAQERVRGDRGFASYKDGVEGVLIEQGSRPYRDNPNADPSPYAVLQDAQGRQHTAWGVGIPNALLHSGAREGDMVRLRETGMETVTKSVIREFDGEQVRVDQPVNRRAWDAEVVREREDLERQAGVDRQTPGDSEREEKINEAEANVRRTVDSKDQALHTGPGRDAAVSEGVYANEARAKEYMAGGRAAAGLNPELVAAASIEAYVERKVRQKFGNDPVAVQRAMTTARNRIGQAVARGVDFPQPRVEDGRERGGRDDSQGGRGEAQRDGDRAQQPEQERDLDRERDGSRGREREPERER